jgi:hypothetical protein
LGIPDLNAVADDKGVAKHAPLVDPGSICTVPIVEDVSTLFLCYDRVMPRDHEFLGQSDVIVWMAANRQAFGGDGESLV